MVQQQTLTPAGQRILDAASRLFYDAGISGVGVDLIAQEAGTTKKTLYDRFGSKDGLVVAYLEARLRRWSEHVDRYTGAQAAQSREGVDRVLVVLDALEDWLAQGTRGCGFVNAYAELSTSSPAATAVVRREKQQVREVYEQVLVDAGLGARPVLARRLALVHEGAIVELTAGESSSALDDARAVVRSLVEAGGSAR